jgi:murein DD-endopeptidase MepM/ murein hydrolase activator NlpD
MTAFFLQHSYVAANKGTTQKSASVSGQALGNNIATINSSKEVALAKNDSKTSEEKKTPEVITYTVKSGDTLSSIANAYGIDVNTITESNKLNANNTLKEGQQLEFPSVKGILIEVKSGENLWDIANSYNINVDSIVSTNALGAPDKIKIGQTLILPGAGKITTANADSNVPVKKITIVKVASKAKSSKTTASKTKVASAKVSSRTVVHSRGGSKSESLGNMIWPVSGPITSGFGNRGDEFHTGIDIGVPSGTHVKAAMDGVVAFAGWDGGYGNLVIIDNGNGIKTYYGHNSHLLVHVGQVVNQGDTISLSGSTGRSTGPHVHFEVRVNNSVVSPYKYL